ncbi:hypothetical protein Sjap_013684 [Stephania japonica]|uniref:Uncharacterized protein n=1 Tax=Stephania japonica TaxID=461633 RepID=A0AAP0J0C9_9MAGN
MVPLGEASFKWRGSTSLHFAFTKRGIESDGRLYSLESIKEAIKEGTGYTPGIDCNVDKSVERDEEES